MHLHHWKHHCWACLGEEETSKRLDTHQAALAWAGTKRITKRTVSSQVFLSVL